MSAGEPTLGTFADACAEYLHEKQRAPSTIADARRTIHGRLRPGFGANTALEDITTETIDAYRETPTRRGRTVAPHHPEGARDPLRHPKRAKRRKWITSNPAEVAERVTVPRSGDFNVLQPTEVHAVARVAESRQDAAIFTVAAFTGLRMGELRALRWEDVDFAKRMIRVRANYTTGGERTRSPARSDRCR